MPFGPVKRAPKWLVYGVCVAVQCMFCVWHVVGKLALNGGVHPLVFALYREVGGTAVLFAVAFVVDGRHVRMRGSDVPTFALLGFLSFTIVVGFLSALAFITAQNAALLQPAVPVFTTLIGIVAGYEAASVRKLVGVGCAVTGAVSVVVLNLGGLTDRDAHDLVLGNVLLVLQTLAVAISVVLQKRVLARYPVCHVAAWSYGFATVFTAVAASYWLDADADTWLFRTPPLPDAAEHPGGSSGSSSTAGTNNATTTASYWPWAALCYAVLVPTACAHSLLAWANTQLRPSTISIFNTIQPFGTTLLALLFLSDTTLNAWHLLGAVLVIAGLLLTTYSAPGDGDDDDAQAIAYDDFECAADADADERQSLTAAAAAGEDGDDGDLTMPGADSATTPSSAVAGGVTERLTDLLTAQQTLERRQSLFYGATATAHALKRPGGTAAGSSRRANHGNGSSTTTGAHVPPLQPAVRRAQSADQQPASPGSPAFGQPASPAPPSPAAADTASSPTDAPPFLTRDASSDDTRPQQRSPDSGLRALVGAALSPADASSSDSGHARLTAVPVHIAADGTLVPVAAAAAAAGAAAPAAAPVAAATASALAGASANANSALLHNPNRLSPAPAHARMRSIAGASDDLVAVLPHEA